MQHLSPVRWITLIAERSEAGTTGRGLIEEGGVEIKPRAEYIEARAMVMHKL
jgi:hypothetical protein